MKPVVCAVDGCRGVVDGVLCPGRPPRTPVVVAGLQRPAGCRGVLNVFLILIISGSCGGGARLRPATAVIRLLGGATTAASLAVIPFVLFTQTQLFPVQWIATGFSDRHGNPCEQYFPVGGGRRRRQGDPGGRPDLRAVVRGRATRPADRPDPHLDGRSPPSPCWSIRWSDIDLLSPLPVVHGACVRPAAGYVHRHGGQIAEPGSQPCWWFLAAAAVPTYLFSAGRTPGRHGLAPSPT